MKSEIYVSPDEGNSLASFGHQSEYDHQTTVGTHPARCVDEFQSIIC